MRMLLVVQMKLGFCVFNGEICQHMTYGSPSASGSASANARAQSLDSGK